MSNGLKDNLHSSAKEKIKLGKVDDSTKAEALARKKVSPIKSSSFNSRLTNNTVEKKESISARTRLMSSRALPSSPHSCYSLPASFEKFSSGIKQQAKVSGMDKALAFSRMGLLERTSPVLRANVSGINSSGSYSLPASFEKFSSGIKQQAKVSGMDKAPAFSRMGSLERSSPVLRANVSGRNSSVRNSMGYSLRSIELGTKALRRSWEGRVEPKGSSSKVSPGEARLETKSETQTASVSWSFPC